MSSLHPYHPPYARCRAGVARRDVTPPVGIQSRCFGAALHETAEGVHRPFTATALALAELEGDGSPMVLLAVDIGWLEKDEMAEFLDGVREPLGLSRTGCSSPSPTPTPAQTCRAACMTTRAATRSAPTSSA